MYRDRIRVRASTNSQSSSLPTSQSVPHGAASETSPAYGRYSSEGEHAPYSMSATGSGRAGADWRDAGTSSHDAGGQGDTWDYVRRIGSLAVSTVASVLHAVSGRNATQGDGDYPDAPAESCSTAQAAPHHSATASSPAVPPNTPYTAADAVAESHFRYAHPMEEPSFRSEPAQSHPSGVVERRRPRQFSYATPAPKAHAAAERVRPETTYAEEAPPPMAAVPRPSVREVAPYQITVNQYFTAPERSVFYPPVTAVADAYGVPVRAAATAYSPRVSALTIPSATRERSHRGHSSRASTAEKPVKAVEAPRRAAAAAKPAKEASDVSLSNAPSAIPLASPENSLTMPVPLLEKAKAAEKPAAAGLGATAGMWGSKPASATGAPFMFGAAPASSSAAAAGGGAAPANAFGGFGKPAPAAAAAAESVATAPGRKDDKADGEKDAVATKAAPAADGPATQPKQGFLFGASSAKPLFGATTATPLAASAATPANVFSFSPKAPEKPQEKPPAPAVNSFAKADPPAEKPDDSGSASNATSEDDEKPTTASTAAAPPAKPAPFAFNASALKPAFSSGSPSPTAATPAAPPAAPPASTPPVNSFFKSGPPAVIADDDGFASNANSDDDGEESGGAKKTKAESAAPAFAFKPAFSFGGGSGASTSASPPSTAPAFNFSLPANASTAPPANPFSFKPSGGASGPAAAPFGSFGASGNAFGTGSASTPSGAQASPFSFPKAS